MAKNEKLVKDITSMSEDFAQWYTDVVKKAQLMEYSNMKGCMILKPNGYAIWESIQRELDRRFKETGHQNVYMPMFIPESLLQREKDHVEGFAPEVAWVTHGGQEELNERLCVRPTSETLFCDMYSRNIKSYRDLPKKYNQWCSVVRWEKTTRPFLRTSEFLWQEGHTAHATAEEAEEETLSMLKCYDDFARDILAIPMVKGKKTDKEKFAGAKETYTIESLMKDGKALQSGTSHNFGDGFAKAFDIKYTDKDNKQVYVHQTSWGVSTRIIGAIIMVHGDDDGLVLPPRIAPTQVMIVPIAQHKDGVIEKCDEIFSAISKEYRVDIDKSDKGPGFKFAEQEIQGIPLRVEIGPKDIENNKCIIVRRDTREKVEVSFDKLSEKIGEILDKMHYDMYDKAKKFLDDNITDIKTYDELEQFAKTGKGFVRAMWCGDESCEIKIKEDFTITSRCIPFEQEEISDKCVCCGRPAKKLVYWGKAY